MQDTQSDLDNCRRLGVDEQHIRFQPSPNFKNMKKFFKSKIDNSESSSQSPPNGSLEQTTPNNTLDSPPRSLHLMERLSPVKSVVQPPLPLEPPPPDSPPIIPVPVKEEIIDEEYQENGHESPSLSTSQTDTTTSPRLSFERNLEEPDSTSSSTERPNKTICRDFIRGACNRAGTCRYAHKCDLSQLPGIFTFCKNYQNTVCTYPCCRYVHASIFEEQEFYRTGIMPPHALSHIKNNNCFMLPPPPPPPPPPEEVPAEVNHNASPVSPLKPAEKPIISCVPTLQLESKPAENDFRNMLQAISSPLKREWSASSFNPPRDIDNKENFAKKCKNCDTMEFRLEFNKSKIESMTRSSEELRNKSTLLHRKSNTLCSVLLTVLKSLAASNGINNLTTTLNMCGEKEKALLHNILENNRTSSNGMI